MKVWAPVKACNENGAIKVLIILSGCVYFSEYLFVESKNILFDSLALAFKVDISDHKIEIVFGVTPIIFLISFEKLMPIFLSNNRKYLQHRVASKI